MSNSEPSSETISRLAGRGAAVLLGQTVLVKIAAACGGVVLARLLTPREFGVYAVVSFVAAFFSIFSDVGLGASLIQQKETPSRDDLATTFTMQAALSILLVSVGFIAAIPISNAYHLGAGGTWLIRALLISIPVGLLRSIPSLLLERDLRYGRLSAIESSEALSFQIVAVVLAILHLGVWSFVCAALARATLGVLVAYLVAPWLPRLGFSRRSARRLLEFGLPYQIQGILSFIKDSMTPTLIALIAGATAVGYINWAFTVAALPLMVTSSLWRVTFPAFSRAQSDLHVLSAMIERSIRLSGIVFLPMSCLLMAAGPEITQYIYTDKWAPALPAFYLFSFSLWTGPLLGSTFFSAFYAMGRSRLAMYFTILYGVLDWGIGVPLVLFMGFNGVAARSILVAYGTLPILLLAVNRILPVRALQQLVRSLPAAVAAGLLEFGLLRILPGSTATLALAAAGGALAYFALIAALERSVLSSTLQRVLPLPVQLQPMLARYMSVRQGAGHA